jgi:hypothetical protein
VDGPDGVYLHTVAEVAGSRCANAALTDIEGEGRGSSSSTTADGAGRLAPVFGYDGTGLG